VTNFKAFFGKAAYTGEAQPPNEEEPPSGGDETETPEFDDDLTLQVYGLRKDLRQIFTGLEPL